MSHRPKSNRKHPPVPPPARRRVPGPTLIVAVVAVVAALGFWGWKSRQAGTSSPTPTPLDPPATNLPAVVAETKPDFRKLKGRWLRPDGGYIVDVRDVEESGRMDVAYFNPRPIHVARAEASRDGALMKVFVELQDVNYPGSTYTLTYDAATDRLAGNYFQALLRENFDVQFVRQP
jgi:hypothetical protein